MGQFFSSSVLRPRQNWTLRKTWQDDWIKIAEAAREEGRCDARKKLPLPIQEDLSAH